MTKLQEHTSIMQNALGVSQQKCQNLCYECNNFILEIQTSKEKLCCPICGSHNIIRNGNYIRHFISVLIGSEQKLFGHALWSLQVFGIVVIYSWSFYSIHKSCEWAFSQCSTCGRLLPCDQAYERKVGLTEKTVMAYGKGHL